MALILVVDDKATMRELVRRMLERADHMVIEAEEGEAGLAAFEHGRPDVVITDLIMPKMDGIETISRIKRLYPSIKIIAMSGADEVNLHSARMLGADETLAKPFERAALLDVVSRLLGCDQPANRNNRSTPSGGLKRPAA